MSENRPYTVELKERQYEYLSRMAEKYDLPDVSKALRCLVNFAIEEEKREEEIFAEIRCMDCY